MDRVTAAELFAEATRVGEEVRALRPEALDLDIRTLPEAEQRDHIARWMTAFDEAEAWLLIIAGGDASALSTAYDMASDSAAAEAILGGALDEAVPPSPSS